MNHLTIIESLDLSTVHGGQQVTVGGKLKAPTGLEAEATLSTTGTPQSSSNFLQCMRDREGSKPWFGSTEDNQKYAERACAGLLGSPTNPERASQR